MTCFEVDKIPWHMRGDTFETTKISVSLYLNVQDDSGGKVCILVGYVISCCEAKKVQMNMYLIQNVYRDSPFFCVFF